MRSHQSWKVSLLSGGGGGTGGRREDVIDEFLLFSLRHSGGFLPAGNGGKAIAGPEYRLGGSPWVKDGNFPPSLLL